MYFHVLHYSVFSTIFCLPSSSSWFILFYFRHSFIKCFTFNELQSLPSNVASTAFIKESVRAAIILQFNFSYIFVASICYIWNWIELEFFSDYLLLKWRWKSPKTLIIIWFNKFYDITSVSVHKWFLPHILIWFTLRTGTSI